MSDIQRQHAEEEFAEELEILAEQDTRPRPPNWLLSPWAVMQYIIGTELDDGYKITPKYYGNINLIQVAIATLATDRALLLMGIPGTAKTWVSEHLAAAISGDSTLLIQGTAGASEEIFRYGWNYARLLAEGPSENALVLSPLMRAMQEGKIARIEELTRVAPDVQDTLITMLSEKTLPIPELNQEVQALRGFNVIATSNDRDRGVNDFSSALKRRFNTVNMPLPDTLEEEIAIVQTRVSQMQKSLELPAEPPALEEIRRVVTIFRELRSGITEDGTTKIQPPSGTLSTAEAISVINNGMALAAYFGEGVLEPQHLVGGLMGTIIKNTVEDETAFKNYFSTVMAYREEWANLNRPIYKALFPDQYGQYNR